MQNQMNYKPLINLKIAEFQKTFPNYSVGDIFYAIFSWRKKGTEFKKSDFLEISDQEFYECASKAFEHEKESADE